ncbi:MAG: cytochrome P450 [Myxococcales bacterium]|nr:cytochrome P450 [Myxococcales bacterium]
MQAHSSAFDSMPIAPGGEGLLGHNADFRADRLGTLRRLSEVTAPVLRLSLPLPGIHAMVANHPDVVEETLVDKARLFDKSDMLRFSLYPLAGEGIFTSNGELWRRQRKLMAPLFHPKALEAYAPDMVACSRRAIDRWRDGEELALAAETTRLAMAVAGKTLFDADTFTEADDLGRALTVALDWAGWVIGQPIAIAHIVARRRLQLLSEQNTGWLRDAALWAERKVRGPAVLVGARGRELASSIALLDERVQKMIDERRRSSGEQTDLLTRLLAASDQDGTVMSDRQIRDEILTLFVAGHETTATGLAWTIHEACKDRRVYDEMQREADSVGDDPGAADLEKLDLTTRAFKEALRLYPPVYIFGRDANQAVTLAGYDLPRSTNVMVSPFVLHRRRGLWGDDPERFDPDRFLPEREAKRHRYAYLPFSAGPRICLGIHFAYLEAPLVLATLMRRFRFELLEEDEAEPSATLRPRRGVRVRVHARR